MTAHAPSENSSTVLLTGAAGFLGRHLQRGFKRVGRDVVIHSGDVRSIHRDAPKARLVVHLAAVTPPAFDTDPANSYSVNVLGTQCVLDYCRSRKAVCIFASTSGVYESSPSPISEDGRLRPARPYTASKFMGEELCRHAAREYGVQTVILRLFNLYGPGQHSPFLIPYIIDCLRNSAALNLRMPHAFRDFIYVADVVSLITRLADIVLDPHSSLQCTETLNVGTGNAVMVGDIVRSLANILGQSEPEFQRATEHAGEAESIIARPDRARELLGWTPQFGILEGLEATLGSG